MKTLQIFFLALALGLMSFNIVSNEDVKTVQTAPNSSITWKTESLDLGEIPQGKPVTISFEFQNSGKEAVVIKDAHASCGCTGTEYPKDTIAPGKSAVIKATFNAANKGGFSKTVTVTTTADENPKVLTFRGTVI